MRIRALILFFLASVLAGGWSVYYLYPAFYPRFRLQEFGTVFDWVSVCGIGFAVFFATAFVRHLKNSQLVPKVGVEVIALMVVAIVLINCLLFYALANI